MKRNSFKLSVLLSAIISLAEVSPSFCAQCLYPIFPMPTKQRSAMSTRLQISPENRAFGSNVRKTTKKSTMTLTKALPPLCLQSFQPIFPMPPRQRGLMSIRQPMMAMPFDYSQRQIRFGSTFVPIDTASFDRKEREDFKATKIQFIKKLTRLMGKLGRELPTKEGYEKLNYIYCSVFDKKIVSNSDEKFLYDIGEPIPVGAKLLCASEEDVKDGEVLLEESKIESNKDKIRSLMLKFIPEDKPYGDEMARMIYKLMDMSRIIGMCDIAETVENLRNLLEVFEWTYEQIKLRIKNIREIALVADVLIDQCEGEETVFKELDKKLFKIRESLSPRRDTTN